MSVLPRTAACVLVALVVPAAVGGLGGCSRGWTDAAEASRPAAEPVVRPPPPTGQPRVHPTGLVLAPQPPSYAVRESTAGFMVEPANARSLRSPWQVDLRLAQKDPFDGAGALRRMKVGDRDARYRVAVDEGGGSGGPMHTLTASMAALACGPFTHIVVIASQQVEPPASPDWSAAWSVLAASRCEPRR